MLVAVLISVGGEMLFSHWLALDHVTSASSYDGPGDGGAVTPTRKAAVLTRSGQELSIKESKEGLVTR